MIESKFYSAAEAAKELNYNVVYFRRLIQSGKVKGEKAPLSGRWRISARELRRLKGDGGSL